MECRKSPTKSTMNAHCKVKDNIVKNPKPGVYFGLSFQDYLAAPSLSTSGIKQLRVSPLTYWANSAMNPDRPKEKETPAMAFGSAVHKRILEGAEAFGQAYAVQPDPDDYPDALNSGQELADRCAELGLKKSGTIAERCERIREADHLAILWPDILEAFSADAAGKIIVKATEMAEIERIGVMVDAHPTAGNVFRDGASEVSVFWLDEETEVPMKARFDYLRVREIIDLKTFSNTTGLPLEMAVIRAIANHNYHVQAAVYLDAAAAARAMVRRGEIHGPPPPAHWMESFAATEESRFFFVFTETGAANNVVVREMVKQVGGAETMLYQAGYRIYRDGIRAFARCRAKYGQDPWVAPAPSGALIDAQFPLWFMEG